MNLSHTTSTSIAALTALALAALAAGCSAGERPLDSDHVTQTARGSLRDHVEGVARAVELTVRAPFWADLDRSIGFGPGDCGTCADPVVVNPADASQLADEIVDRLLTADSVESSSDTEVTYRLRADRVCDGDNGCEDALALAAVRLVVTSPAEGALDIAVLIGESRLHPFTFHLSGDRVSADVDIAQLRDVIALYAGVLDLDPGALPTIARGRLTIGVTRNSEANYSADLAITQTIEISSMLDGGDYSLAIDQGSTASVRIDGITHRLESNVSFGAIDAEAAFSLFAPLMEECTSDAAGNWTCTQPTLHGTLGLHAAGVTGHGLLDATNRRFDATGVGLGAETSRITFDGQDLMTIDLNAALGRALDFALEGGDSALDLTLEPGFQVATGIFFQRIANQVNDLPAWTLDDHSSVSLTGSNPSIRIPYETAIENGPDRVLTVTGGTLTLAGDSLVSAVEVEAGACLLLDEVQADRVADEGVHPLTAFFSGACP